MAKVGPAVIADTSLAPVTGFRFGIEIGGNTVAWFTECSGLSIERTVLPHEEGGVNDYVHQLPDRLKYSSITLKRGISDGRLWGWFRQGLYDGKVKRENVSILLYNTDRSKVKRWNLVRAFPSKWTGPDFKAEGNDVAVETLVIVHEGMTMTGWT